MKFTTSYALALAAGATGFVIPSEQVLAELQPNAEHSSVLESAEHYWNHVVHEFKSGGESVYEGASRAKDDVKDLFDNALLQDHPMGFLSEDETNGGGHHHHKKLTIYQLISKSKYTTKLAGLIEEYDDIKESLNSTDIAYTVFAPTDKAFEKIPKHAKKPSKEFLKALLTYHVVPEVYTAKDILGVHTLPSLLGGDGLSSNGSETLQRLGVGLGLRGVYVNKYVHVTYPNVFATNGIIHAVDSIIVPPPPITTIIGLFPTAFSTLDLALRKAGLGNIGDAPHLGATFFAPPNSAWRKLGFKLNAFLFSKFGTKYLKGILKYHVVANQTLYSDHYYGSQSVDIEDIPKGRFHIDLPTLLDGATVGVDVGRYGGLISMHVNHYSRVVAQDAIAKDGVLHVINSILLPPRKHDHHDDDEETVIEEMSVEDFKELMDPYLEADDEDEAAFNEPEPDWENLSLEL